MPHSMPENHPDHPTFGLAFHDVSNPLCFSLLLGVTVADGIVTISWLHWYADGRVITAAFTEYEE